MTDHNPDVAAVLEQVADQWDVSYHITEAILAVLTTAGYAVVRLPEGVVVEHGARLRRPGVTLGAARRVTWIIEPPSEAP